MLPAVRVEALACLPSSCAITTKRCYALLSAAMGGGGGGDRCRMHEGGHGRQATGVLERGGALDTTWRRGHVTCRAVPCVQTKRAWPRSPGRPTHHDVASRGARRRRARSNTRRVNTYAALPRTTSRAHLQKHRGVSRSALQLPAGVRSFSTTPVAHRHAATRFFSLAACCCVSHSQRPQRMAASAAAARCRPHSPASCRMLLEVHGDGAGVGPTVRRARKARRPPPDGKRTEAGAITPRFVSALRRWVQAAHACSRCEARAVTAWRAAGRNRLANARML